MASLPPCRLYGAAMQRSLPLGPGQALTLPCGWDIAGPPGYVCLANGTDFVGDVCLAKSVGPGRTLAELAGEHY